MKPSELSIWENRGTSGECVIAPPDSFREDMFTFFQSGLLNNTTRGLVDLRFHYSIAKISPATEYESVEEDSQVRHRSYLSCLLSEYSQGFQREHCITLLSRGIADSPHFQRSIVGSDKEGWTVAEWEWPVASRHRYYEEIQSSVREFCTEKGVWEHLHLALNYVEENFERHHDIQFSLEEDPEIEDEKWIVIDVGVDGTIEDALDAYDKYTRQWVSAVPWPIRDLIRVSYYLT